MVALATAPGWRGGRWPALTRLWAGFGGCAKAVGGRLPGGTATVGEVHGWLEATGTEPTAIIGLHVWEEEPARTPLGHEMHDLLVAHLEERLAAGYIHPDQLLAADPVALQQYRALQERWLS